MKSWSAIIVHYRTADLTVAAARSVAEISPQGEVIVVDNASGDGIGQRLAREVPAVRTVSLPENRGYGAGCNAGARVAGGQLLLFLNSDVVVRPDAISRLAAALEARPGAAVVGPQLRNSDGSVQPSIQRLPTPWRIFCESSGAAALFGGRGPFRGHTKTREDHAKAQAVESLLGAALLIRREAFERVGGFDEAFFLYAEETDLLRRLRDLGYTILYEPSAVVEHRGGASAGEGLRFELHASLTRYARKHHGRGAELWTGLVLAAGAAVRYLAALVTPGERGRRRRERYRSALGGPAGTPGGSELPRVSGRTR